MKVESEIVETRIELLYVREIPDKRSWSHIKDVVEKAAMKKKQRVDSFKH